MYIVYVYVHWGVPPSKELDPVCRGKDNFIIEKLSQTNCES